MDMNPAEVTLLLDIRSRCYHLTKNPNEDNVYKFLELMTNHPNISILKSCKGFFLTYCLHATIISLQITFLR